MSPKDDQTARSRHLVRNTALVMAFFGLSAVAGTVRNMVIAYRFGIGGQLDAYYAAFKLPDLLFTIVAGGALATAFIPVFAGLLSGTEEGQAPKRDLEGAWRLASDITNLVVLVTGVAAVLTAVFAPSLVRHAIAPGFDAANQELTANLMRVVLISIPIFAISAVQTSVLHAFKHFFLPALAPVLYPVGVIIGAIWLTPRLGIYGLAVGAVLGALLHLAVKVPWLLRLGLRWWPAINLKSPAVHRVLLLMGPRVLDLGVFHLTFLAMTNLASRLEAGSVSALEWGWGAMQLPETVIGTAFGLVAFPTLSELAARGDTSGIRGTLGETLRLAVTLALPAAFGLILLGRPLLQVLYQRGAFGEAATQAVYVALVFFALGLVGHVSLELAARTFFAQKDTVTPLWIATGSGIVNVGLGLLLMGPLGHGGLALSNSLAVSAEVLVLLFILRRRLGGIEGRQTLLAFAKSLAGSIVMAAAVLGVLEATAYLELSPIVTLAAGAAVGAVAYIVAGLLLGIEAIRRVPALLLSVSR